MKKKLTIFIIAVIVLILSGGVMPAGDDSQEIGHRLIRIHVLANSDSEADQALKYMVKDAIVKEMAQKFSASRSIEESREILLSSLSEVEAIAETTLTRLGSDYEVEAQYGRFFFPTKYYGSFTLPAGEYEAVRVVIGEGKGANWWCVLFPPLCFVAADETQEISKVKNGYPVNSNEGFKKEKVRVSFKLKEVIKDSFAILARIFN
ncbi:MAG: stage II sporulation protein R [Clostridia bacterium]|nr:stage II sporulation protein R [Clostridia bacterium]